MKIIVLKQGVHNDLGSKGREVYNKISEICGAVILLKAEIKKEKNIIIDVGNRGYAGEIVNTLKKQGLNPEDIDFVLSTHTHFDHISNNYLFKNADIVRDTGVWHPDKSLTVYNDIKFIEVTGVRIIKTPGHDPHHTSFIAECDGKTYVIAGDAIQEEYIKKGLFGIPINQDYIDSAKKIVDIADVVIPGHGRIIQGEDLEELKQAVYKMKVK